MSNKSSVLKNLEPILNQLKLKNQVDYAIQQLINLINFNKEHIEDIIKRTADFFNELISGYLQTKKPADFSFTIFYKVINAIIAKLEENNLSLAKFINSNFPTLMLMVSYFNGTKTEFLELLKVIGDLMQKCGNNVSQFIDIESNLVSIFSHLTSEQHNINLENKKYEIMVLCEFLKHAPITCYNKITNSSNEFTKIISNYNNPNGEIRQCTQRLIEEFLKTLAHKDPKTQEEQTKYIFDLCIKDFNVQQNDTNTIHGMILVLKALTTVKTFFNKISKKALTFLSENLNNNKTSFIKTAIIQTIPDFCEFLGDEYFAIFMKYFIDTYLNGNSDEINSQILITFGKLSLVPTIEEKFGNYSQRIIGIIRNKITDNTEFNVKTLDCFSDIMTNFGEEFGAILPFSIYCDKIFACGLTQSHLRFLENLISLYEQDSKENIQITMCLLNVISYIITNKEFTFKETFKRLQSLSNQIRENVSNSPQKPSKKSTNDISLSPTKASPISISKMDLRKSLSMPVKDYFCMEDFAYYNKVGKSISTFLDNLKYNKNTKDIQVLRKNAFTLLSYINNKYFEKDILKFYEEKCISILNDCDNETKKIIINLAKSSWIPELYFEPPQMGGKRRESISSLNTSQTFLDPDIEYNLNFILEYFLNSILNESDDEIKLLILNTIDYPRYYQFISKTSFFSKLACVIEFDNNAIKEKVVDIIGKIILYNPNTIRTYIKKKIFNIFMGLEISNNQFRKEESIVLLSYFVKYTGNYIVDEVEMIFSTLLKILKDETSSDNDNSENNLTNDKMIIGILSIISELMKNIYYNKKQIEPCLKDIIIISINFLKKNAASSIHEETALYAIFSILSNSKIKFEYLELVNLIIHVLTKSQNKQSRIYALKIFGFIGAMNPDKFKKLNLHKVQNDTSYCDYYLADELLYDYSEEETSYPKKEIDFDTNEKDKKKKYNLTNNLEIDIGKNKAKFDFEKAIQEKTLNSTTFYAILALMKIIKVNKNHEVTSNIIKILKSTIEKLKTSESDHPIIYLILPTLINSLDNFEGNDLSKTLEIIKNILVNFKENCVPYLEDFKSISIKYLNDKDNQYVAIEMIEKICIQYPKEISPFLQELIPLILNLLQDKPEKESTPIETKKKVISCLLSLNNKLSSYLPLVIPEIINCLISSINQKKFKNNANTNTNNNNLIIQYLTNNTNSSITEFAGSQFPFIATRKRSNSQNENNAKKEMSLDDEIFCLINSLLSFPAITKYFEKIINTLLLYMEVVDVYSEKTRELILKMFIRMLSDYQQDFMIFFPYILKFMKNIGIKTVSYFDPFRVGIEKVPIMSVLTQNSKYKNILKSLPAAGYMEQREENTSNSYGASSPMKIKNKNESVSKNKSNTTATVNSNENEHSKSVDINNSNNTSNNNSGLDRKISEIEINKLLKEFNPSKRGSEEDWHEWFKTSSKKLFEQSPSDILKNCHSLSMYDPQIINELYNSAFYSVWRIFNPNQRSLMIKYLNEILNGERTPNDILYTILNLNEFINREENNNSEFIEFEKLGNVAETCNAYAKALYYFENDYTNNDELITLEKLMTLYIDLSLPESGSGILELAKSKPNFNQENERECQMKLHKWKEALSMVENKLKKSPDDKKLLKEKIECLEGLSDWENLIELGEKNNLSNDFSKIFSKAALNLGEWEKLKKYSNNIVETKDDDIYENNFFKAILSIKDEKYSEAQKFIDIARESIDDKIKTLLSESYERAYKLLLANENLFELEEIIDYFKLNTKENNHSKQYLKMKWDERLDLKDEDIKTYERIIGIRRIIFPLKDDYQTTLKLSKICREKDKFSTCMLVLNRLQKNLQNCRVNDKVKICLAVSKCIHDNSDIDKNLDLAIEKLQNILDNDIENVDNHLKSKIYCYFGMWCAEKIEKNLNENDVNKILSHLTLSTNYNKKNYKAWHYAALLNYKFVESQNNFEEKVKYAINAIEGFTKSVVISGKNFKKTLQDLLRLIDVWFQVGQEEKINNLMNTSIKEIQLESWLLVIPQLLARINVTNPLIRNTLIDLLKRIGNESPRSLNYPLIVLKQSKSKARAEVVSLILDEVRKKHRKLFNECELIINELNRCALCLHEQWSESIEESAKLFFQSKDIKGATKILNDLHNKTNKKPQTINEVHFHQLYKGELSEAYKYLKDYMENNNLTSFKQAWDIYHACFRSIAANFSSIEMFDLESISPELFNFSQSEIEIPGLYRSGKPIVKISSFAKKLIVLNSKQHPRKIVIYGSDGKEYPFLLKGHEDIRQDERVMQLFRLINTLLSNDSDTREQNLFIKRFPVIPLSHNTGIIGWVSNCDTLHQLIKEYRLLNKIHLNTEHRLMASFFYRFDTSKFMTKLEVFKHALSYTLGVDLCKSLWNKSKNAEAWLDRRKNYSRSLAVMSMVGYILGLGDRHPSNIMLDRLSGKILHIDFGDCFEVAMKREKFPEKVPFRLTRTLIKALEIGGIEGTFRKTCENVMRVIRENKDSLIVILAAFVHDPLISFRLLIPLIMKQNKKNNLNEDEKEKENDESQDKKMTIMGASGSKEEEEGLEKRRVGSAERQLYSELEEKDDIESDDLNKIAKIVLERIMDKLQGSDFNKNERLDVVSQVQKLIKQATSHENLSQSYLGWCPFW